MPTSTKDTRIVTEGPEKLLGIRNMSLGVPRTSGNDTWSFDPGDRRQQIGSIYHPDDSYTFLRTKANPDAVDELLRYVSTPKGSGLWETRPRQEEDEPTHCPGSVDGLNGLWFSPSLLDLYIDVLHYLAEARMGEDRHVSFPLIGRRGVHNLDRPRGYAHWPVVHVVRGKNEDKTFREEVADLNGDAAYGFATEREAPQNYQMKEVDLLRELQVPPLVVDEREWHVGSDELRDAVDFLVPFTLIHEYHGPVMEMD